jgi:acetyl-CoA carboxylase carboxyl transferase subunit beta
MNWISNFVRPKIRALVHREVPENLWNKCPSCSQMIFHRELEAKNQVCPHCGHHMRIGARKRLSLLFDDGQYNLIELPETPVDPLRFRDRKRYSDRLKEAQSKGGDKEAILVAHGKMGGMPTVIAAFDFSFMGGSMGVAVGEGLIAAARLAVIQEAALIAIPASGGARMQEGILSLMQLPRTVIAVEDVKDAGLPYIVLLTDPTTGGVSASFAMLGDIAIAEPGAIIGFAGQRVIEETIRETLPEGFQRAEYLLEHGMIDMVVHRDDLRPTLIRLLRLLRETAPAADVVAMPQAERTPPHGKTDSGGEPATTPPAAGE